MASNVLEEVYAPRGAAATLFGCQGETEVLLSGPAGTGKSRAILEYLNWIASTYPNVRILMVRKTRRSLTESGMVTFERRVLHSAQGVRWNSTKQQYPYPNGSIIAVGGLDKPGKIMSSEWDIIYVQEATELTEADWEACTTRLRNNKLFWQQIVADCNPDAPAHWLNQRCIAHKCLMLESRHEDNPVLYDERGIVTQDGGIYLDRLDKLSGVRYLRLRQGRWAAAEGVVYDGWNVAANVVDRFPIPAEWPRYLAIDFGYSNPFVCLWAAIDPDGRIVVYREIYMTARLVEDHAADIKGVSQFGRPGGDPLPRLVICDHDAEDRYTLERHVGLRTIPAKKAISAGIQNVAVRIRPAGDAKPRLVIFRDALVRVDSTLRERHQPTSTIEEFEMYVWDTRNGRKKGETPIDAYNHGLDALRYLVNQFDLLPSEVSYSERVY
jgi:phage terminase large subunit